MHANVRVVVCVERKWEREREREIGIRGADVITHF